MEDAGDLVKSACRGYAQAEIIENGVASRALEAVCESWWKLARVCVFLVFVALAGSCWWGLRFW